MTNQLQTPSMGWPLPQDEQEPWYAQFIAFANAMDADAYALCEYQRTVLATAANPTMNYGSSTLSWADPLEFISCVTGQIATVAPGSISLPDGTILWVQIPRPMVQPVTLTIQSGSQMTPDRRNQLLAVRRGSRTYLPMLGLVL